MFNNSFRNGVFFLKNNALNSKNSPLQVIRSSIGTVVDCSVGMYYDDTIPQKTEGVEVLTATITPKSINSILEISFFGTVFLGTPAVVIITAIFQDANANAIAARGISLGISPSAATSIIHYMLAGTVSPTTFKVRVGGADFATPMCYLNGNQVGTQVYGGVSSSSLTIIEYSS